MRTPDWTEESLRAEVARIIQETPSPAAAAESIVNIFLEGGYGVLGVMNGDLTACYGYCNEDRD